LALGVLALGWWGQARSAARIEAAVAAAAAPVAAGSVHGARVTVEGRDLTIRGLADGPAERDALIAALEALPGRRVVVDALQVLPLADPFALEAGWQAGSLTAEGVLPDESVQAWLRGFFVDGPVLAAGAPDRLWGAALQAGIDGLMRLDQGRLSLIGRDLVLIGIAATPPAGAEVEQAVRAALPEGYSARFELTFRDDGSPPAYRLRYAADTGPWLEGKLPVGTSAGDVAAALGLADIDDGASVALMGEPGAVSPVLAALAPWLPEIETLEVSVAPEGTRVLAGFGAGADMELLGAALGADLARRLALTPDYERRLDAARVWMKEVHFRIGVHHLRGLIDAFEAAGQYAQLAEAVLAAVWPVVADEFARKHGPAPGRGAVVLGMGSLGAGRLNAASDLDLIVIYDAAGDEASQGPRPLAARAYFARLTQALVTALSAPMAQGRLYEVDMRLRPSGRQGPVATSLDAFKAYQQNEAWTWEHLALTRARQVAGSAALGDMVEAFRTALLAQKAGGAGVAQDVADMRARLRAAKPGLGGLEVKDGAGRLQDIEMLAQMLALKAASPARRPEAQIAAGKRAGLLDSAAAETLLGAYRLLWRVQCALRLLGLRGGDPAALGEGARAFLLRETGAGDLDTLLARVEDETRRAASLVEAALPDAPPAPGKTLI